MYTRIQEAVTVTKPKVPSYRRQRKPTGDLAFVVLNGQRTYLGDWNTTESREAYRRVVAEFLATGQVRPVEPELVRVVELIAKFMGWAETYYVRPNGQRTTSTENYKIAFRPLRALYSSAFVSEFTPAMLKVVREQYIGTGMCRGVVNQLTGLVKRLFKWGVSEGLVPAAVWQALTAVEGLRYGRSGAREPDPVRPVPEAHIEAIMPYVSSQVQALIRLQLLTGARAGEAGYAAPDRHRPDRAGLAGQGHGA